MKKVSILLIIVLLLCTINNKVDCEQNFKNNTHYIVNKEEKEEEVVLEKNVTLTVYHPVESQCDDSPLVTANGTKIDLEKLKNGEIKYCALSRDLLKEIPYGSVINIEGYGEYKVVDTMNKRFKERIDILQDVSEKGFKKENVKITKIS